MDIKKSTYKNLAKLLKSYEKKVTQYCLPLQCFHTAARCLDPNQAILHVGPCQSALVYCPANLPLSILPLQCSKSVTSCTLSKQICNNRSCPASQQLHDYVSKSAVLRSAFHCSSLRLVAALLNDNVFML